MIKLVAIDLDGTLLNNQKQISEKNKSTLQKAKDQGVKIVICTGRPLKAIDGFLEELNLQEEGDYSITFNGGLVQKNDTGEMLEKITMSYDEIKELAQLMGELDLPFDVLSDALVYQLPTSAAHPSIYSELNKALDFEGKTLEQLTEDGLYNKVVVATDADYLDQQIAKIPAEFYEKYEIVKSRDCLLEFMTKGVTKAYGLSLLAEDLNIKQSEVMTLGDEENDLPMIIYAGIGVAMENAVPIIKEHADYITDTNENDGVAKAVEKFVLSKENKEAN